MSRSIWSRTRVGLYVISFVVTAALVSRAQTFVLTGSMETVRYGHSETALQNLGKVLVAGGMNQVSGVTLGSAELYDPATGLFTPTGNLVTARWGQTATLLNNGKVLITGGQQGTLTAAFSSAELYDPATGKFTATGSMHYSRVSHTATLLQNGKVLIAGGRYGNSALASNTTATAELYDPATGTFTVTGSLNAAREQFTATLLLNGDVLVVEGLGKNNAVLYSAELYNPTTGTFSLTGSLPIYLGDHFTGTLLYNGEVLIVGAQSLKYAYLYNPSTGAFSRTAGDPHQITWHHTATLLNNGQVLIAGGESTGGVSATAEIYDPPSGTFIVTGSLVNARYDQRATLLDNGLVLLTGGDGPSTELQTAELYQVVNNSPPENGFIDPKYVVLAVTYAPPGSKSNVNYGTSKMIGTSTSITNTLTSGVSESVSVGGGFNIYGSGSNVTGTASTSYTQQEDTSSSVAINQTATGSTVVFGPLSSAAGVDHDYDIVWVWLNPKVNIALTYNIGLTTPGAVLWGGFTYDNRDPAGEMDVIPMYATWLKNPSTIPSPYPAAYLARSWDQSGLGGLTTADYAAILARDPFATNPSYNPSTDPTTRFDLQGGEDFPYEPPAAGGQPVQKTYGLSVQQTTTAGQTATDTYQVQFSLDEQFTLSFLADIKVDLKNQSTTTWQNKWSQVQTEMVGATASLSLTGPASTDNYQGPTEMQVWKDNVYGTFMFYPIVAPNYTISATPSSRTVTAGGQTTYTVSTAAVDGFTGTVTFGVSGLPTGVSATFSPTSAAVGSSTTLTLSSSSSTSAGSYTIFVTSSSGTLTPYTPVTLIVNSGPSFSISASPTAQSVLAGGSTTYSVSTTALQGFTGVVQLTVTGLPSGSSATFTPASITASGTSTLTVTTSSSTPAGGYTLTITGTSGSLVQTVSVALTTIGNTPNFTLTLTPDGEGVTAGGTATYTIAVTPLNGFTGTVTFKVTGLPSGATGTFVPTSITRSGSTSLTVTTSTSTPLGGYTLMITGTSGSLVDTVLGTITVN